MLHRLLSSTSPATAVVDGEVRWSGADLDQRSGRLAGGLARLGTGLGTPVVFQLGIEADAVALYRAIWRLGAVAVPVHNQAGGALISPMLEQLAAAGTDPVLVAGPGTPLTAVAGCRGVGDLVGAPSADPVEVDPTARALVMFTSGSSGVPKGVVHTHASLAHKPAWLIDMHQLGASSASLVPAPLAHVAGLLHAVLCPAVGGFKAVLMRRWDAGIALDLIEREQVTYMVGPPTFFLALMDHPAFSPARVASLALLSVGGTAITTEFVDRAESTMACIVKRAYGSTEAPSICTSHNDDSPYHRTRTDGRPGPGSLAVADPASGEIRLRGPEVATGYLDPAMDDGVFVDGWYHTGDVGTVDDDGWVTIEGRLSATIIRGGENISIAAVEAMLEAHPVVTAAVVVGRPDDRLGETVAAAVTTTGSFTVDDCRAWFDSQGATRFTCPETVLVLDQLPLLPFGKPDRQAVARLVEGDR